MYVRMQVVDMPTLVRLGKSGSGAARKLQSVGRRAERLMCLSTTYVSGVLHTSAAYTWSAEFYDAIVEVILR